MGVDNMNYKDIEREMRKTYNGICAKYSKEAEKNWKDKSDIDKFLKYLDNGASIMDIACGVGELLKYYDEHNFRVSGFDISDEMVKISKSKVPYANVYQMSIYDMDKMDGLFDAISATFIFAHIPKEKIGDVINNIKNKLKPGGIFFTIFATSLTEGLQADPIDNDFNYYAVNYTKEEICNVLTENNFEILESYSKKRLRKSPIEVVIAKTISID